MSSNTIYSKRRTRGTLRATMFLLKKIISTTGGGVLRQDARVCTKKAIFYAKVANADGMLGEMSAFITDEEDADISPRASQDELAVPSSAFEIELSTVESGIALVSVNPADERLPGTGERERQPDANSPCAIDDVADSSCNVS